MTGSTGSNGLLTRLPSLPLCLFHMARLRTYGQLTNASLDGRTFYSNPRKRVRPRRAPILPALKEQYARERVERRSEYAHALTGAREDIEKHALQLRETFGGHSTQYYIQEIYQRGRVERGRRKASRWNAFLRNEVKKRNDGMLNSNVRVH